MEDSRMITPDLAYRLVCMFYKMVLRDLIYGIVIDTKNKFDDNLLLVCDKLFEYNKEIPDEDFTEAMGKVYPMEGD
jgi:hypothetical protein